MVTSGYNNVNATPQTGDGGGYLYVLDAVTGQIIYKIPTGVGDATTPSGLAQINNFVDKADINNLTVRVYGTDVLGNIWRFDVNDNTPPAGREATLVATATDGSGNPQPITIRPELTQVGNQPMLFVATGKLLGATDVADVQTQTHLRHHRPGHRRHRLPEPAHLAGAADHDPGRQRPGRHPHDQLQRHDRAVRLHRRLADRPARHGRARQRRDEAALRAPWSSAATCRRSIACAAGGYSWLNYLNYASGLAVNTSGGLSVSEQVANSLIVGLTVVKLPNGSQGAIVTTSDAGVLTRDIPINTVPAERQARQLARGRLQ